MTDVKLTAPLTRGGRDIPVGETVGLPASLAGKLVDRGRAVLRDRVIHAAPAGGENDNRE